MKALLVAIVGVLAPLTGSAQVLYKCVEGGVTTYAERPCGKSAVAVGKADSGRAVEAPAADKQVSDPMKPIYDKVALDALERLRIVVRNGGDAMDLCVHTGLVTSAFLQAKEDAYYRKWKEAEKKACDLAGIRR